MDGNIVTIGSIAVHQREEKSFEGYTVARKRNVGRVISFHLTDEKIDIILGYVIFINGERDIRTLEVHKEFETFGRLLHGLRLAIQPLPNDHRSLYAELRQALPKDSFDKHETLHPTISQEDLDDGAKLSVFAELRKVGATVGTKQELIGDTGRTASYLCLRFPKDNLWAPVIAYVTTRILPIYWGYRGYGSN